MMNYLVILDAQAGELERILSRVKTMLIREFDPAGASTHPVNPGDTLYFLRTRDECVVRVQAVVARVSHFVKGPEEDLSQTLKEMQPKLQLTEDQYNDWSAKKQVQLVEFESAQKIGVIHVAPQAITERSDWIAFDAFSLIMEKRDSMEKKGVSYV